MSHSTHSKPTEESRETPLEPWSALVALHRRRFPFHSLLMCYLAFRTAKKAQTEWEFHFNALCPGSQRHKGGGGNGANGKLKEVK